MITRLLFIWFLKEKDLVPSDIFEEQGAQALLKNFDLETSDYYQAALQNLFFATLNTPIDKRVFSKRNNEDTRNANRYRYADLLENPDAFLEHLKQVPFVNGGLFDSLDSFKGQRAGGVRVDCFTDNPNDRRKLHVPAKLFFQKENGIFEIFSRYKFTVEENTPVEQEVALDPELLGQVFETSSACIIPNRKPQPVKRLVPTTRHVRLLTTWWMRHSLPISYRKLNRMTMTKSTWKTDSGMICLHTTTSAR